MSRAGASSSSGYASCCCGTRFPTWARARFRACPPASWRSRIPRCCAPRTCSRRWRRRWIEARRLRRTALGWLENPNLEGTPRLLASRFQPVNGIQGDPPTSPDLEVQMRPLVARPAAHVADDLPLEDPPARGHRRVAQVSVEGVLAAPVID